MGNGLHLFRKVDAETFDLIVAFRGWPDAKRIATYAAEYLRDKVNAERIGEIDAAPFSDFAIQRPSVRIEKGLIIDYELPKNELYAAKSKAAAPGLLILIGAEPNTNWRRYIEVLLGALDFSKAHRVCLLGGLIDRIPHTVEPLISGVATTPRLVEEMKLHGVEPTDYAGPSGIHSLIISESGKRGIPTISLWGHTPEYIRDADARTAHQLLSKVKSILGIDVDLEDLQKEGSLLRKELDALMKENQTFSELVHELEMEYKISRRKPGYIT